MENESKIILVCEICEVLGEKIPNKTTREAIAELESGKGFWNMNWQPIDTAPKDGTYIFAYGPFQWETYINENTLVPAIVVICWDKSVNRWELIHSNPYSDYCQPTHWMPLPEPPQS